MTYRAWFAILGLSSCAFAADEWPSPITWKPDERAVKSELYIKPHAAAKKERVEFTVSEPSGVARKNDAVRGAIPLYRGELADPKQIRLLDAAGKEVPVQGRATAYWPEKTVRYLCLDFLTDLGANQEKKFTLEYGSDVKPATSALKVDAKENGGDIATGSAVYSFRPGKEFLKVSLQKPAKSFKPVTGRALVSKTPDGANPVSHPLIIDTVEVREKGPVQATVHLTGHYGEEKSAPPPAGIPNEITWKYPASLFVRVYAGTGQAYVEHSFGYNANEYSEFVQSYGLTIPTGIAKGKFLYGGDEGAGKESALGVRLNQYAHNEWELIGKAEAKGKRFGGWGAIKGDGVQVMAALREAWQNWPVAINAAENGDLTYEIMCEKTGRALDLRYLDAPNGNFFKSHSMNVGDELSTEYGDPDFAGHPQGIIKIHELKLDFAKEDDAITSSAQAHQVPLVPWAGQERVAKTEALGVISVYGDAKYDSIRNYYSIMLDAFPTVHESNGLYGWVDWGDMPMCNGIANGKFKLHLEGGIGWSNGERSVGAFFYHYAVGGGRRFFDLGRAMVHHTIGIDVEHLGGDWRRGGYLRHDQIHWRQKGGTRQGGFVGWHTYVWLSGDPEVERLALFDGIDAPANAMTLNLSKDAADVSVCVDDQTAAAWTVAKMSWITTGDWRYARAIHGISRYWELCGKEGKRSQQGWAFLAIGKDGEPKGYSMGDPGAQAGYWCTYGGDDLLLDWASLTGDPAAVDALILWGKNYRMEGEAQYSYISPEAALVGVAYLDPTNANLHSWIDFRMGVHACLKDYQARGQKPTGVYANADEWNKFAVGDYGFGIFGSDGKNGFSIAGAEAREILMLNRASERLADKK